MITTMLVTALVGTAQADTLEIGQEVPNIELTDLEGNPVNLEDYEGKTVVLEWFNPGCPYVKYAHDEGGPLVEQPKKAAEEDSVVWLAVNSGAPGKQGHGVKANKEAAEAWGMEYPILPDETGEHGNAYGAKTTPHMYVIDAEGKLAYQGALDNNPMGRNKDQETVNYVDQALTALADSKPVPTPTTKPYGCSVKY